MRKDRKNIVVITEHQNFVDYLLKWGWIDEKTPVMEFARKEDVKGKDVIGKLPVYLAAQAATISCPVFSFPEGKGGRTFTIEEMEKYIVKFVTYMCKEIETTLPEEHPFVESTSNSGNGNSIGEILRGKTEEKEFSR